MKRTSATTASPTTLTGSALYLKLRSEYGIDETLPNSTVRTLIGLRYSLASAKMNGSTTFEFASDVDVSLISLIKDGNYAGVQVDTSSVRVYETDSRRPRPRLHRQHSGLGRL